MLTVVSKKSILYRGVRRVLNTALDPIFWRRSRKEFLQNAPRSSSIDESFSFVNSYKGAGFYTGLRPFQEQTELRTAAKKIMQLDPRIVVEIGTCWGGTFITWGLIHAHLELLVSIDLPSGNFGGGYPSQRGKLYKLVNEINPKCEVELLRVDSHSATTRDNLERILAGRSIDFLFLDGDHRYNGVKRDYELYAPFVRRGGVIAFHDIIPNLSQPDIEVHRLWQEVKQSGLAEEVICDPSKSRYGIGLLTKNEE